MVLAILRFHTPRLRFSIIMYGSAFDFSATAIERVGRQPEVLGCTIYITWRLPFGADSITGCGGPWEVCPGMFSGYGFRRICRRLIAHVIKYVLSLRRPVTVPTG